MSGLLALVWPGIGIYSDIIGRFVPGGPEQAFGLAQDGLVDHPTLETEDSRFSLSCFQHRVGPHDLIRCREVCAPDHRDLARVDAGRRGEAGGRSILGLPSLPLEVGNIEMYGVDRGLLVSASRQEDLAPGLNCNVSIATVGMPT